MLVASDTPEAIAKSMGLGTISFAQSYARLRPDILVVLGDRFEMHAAAVAALPFKIPIAHIHGGEITEGAIDDALRHSITKLSHLHFVSTNIHAKRVIQLGEEPWRVIVSGAPGLDNLLEVARLSRQELTAQFGLIFEDRPFLLVTYHPVTLEYEETDWQVTELLAALEEGGWPIVFTLPNADTSGRTVAHLIKRFTEDHPAAQLVDNLGTQGYFSMMAFAGAMVGNSSSGLVEAPSFELPVVNIGNRQKGRVRASNVIDVGYGQEEIKQGIEKALSSRFRVGLRGLKNPYGKGQASSLIVETLKEISLGKKLLVKRFYSLDGKIEGLGD
jgi:UDP-N-acetylglucosamine 2-epimerase (non-hydrolysing)/GDP/UDP-N,N'-diacetylbacillosamine 2-epimerase (hydrolysing)